MLMLDGVEIGAMQDPNMASNKSKKGKGPIIDVNPKLEDDIEADVGAIDPIYNDTTCFIDIGVFR
jgi:hypothetical protein